MTSAAPSSITPSVTYYHTAAPVDTQLTAAPTALPSSTPVPSSTPSPSASSARNPHNPIAFTPSGPPAHVATTMQLPPTALPAGPYLVDSSTGTILPDHIPSIGTPALNKPPRRFDQNGPSPSKATQAIPPLALQTTPPQQQHPSNVITQQPSSAQSQTQPCANPLHAAPRTFLNHHNILNSPTPAIAKVLPPPPPGTPEVAGSPMPHRHYTHPCRHHPTRPQYHHPVPLLLPPQPHQHLPGYS